MFLKTFLKDDSGAVTVDWVVLSAAAISLALATFAAISTASQNTSAATSGTLQSGLIHTSFD